MNSGTMARMCAIIAAFGCAACSADPSSIAQKPASAPQVAAKPAGADVMVVVPTAGRTLLPYPDTDAFRQCAPFARAVSGIDIYGDAWSWWGKAAGRYQRGNTPEIGAVMVLQRSRRTPAGHVSVVAEMQDSRHILVTHANWGSDGTTRGMIHERQPVEDMSAANDWSVVKMWNTQAEFGSNYQTYGFVYNRPAEAGQAVVEPALAREEGVPARIEPRRSLVQPVSYAPEPASRRSTATGKAVPAKAVAAPTKGHAPATMTKAAHEAVRPAPSHPAPAPAKTAAAKPADSKSKHGRAS